jgi:hypothetical protein
MSKAQELKYQALEEELEGSGIYLSLQAINDIKEVIKDMKDFKNKDKCFDLLNEVSVYLQLHVMIDKKT